MARPGNVVSTVPTSKRLREPADHSYDLALDMHLARVDRLHLAVGGLEADPVALLVEALERGGAVLEERDDDVTIARRGLLLDHDVVAVVDVVLDHRLPADAQDEGVAPALRREIARDAQRLALVRVRVDGRARGDLAHDRRAHRAGGHGIRDGERSRPGRRLGQPALALELGEVGVGGGRRGQPHRLGDLPDARRIAALGDRFPDESEDAVGPVLVLFRHAQTIPNGCSLVKRGHILQAWSWTPKPFRKWSSNTWSRRSGPSWW